MDESLRLFILNMREVGVSPAVLRTHKERYKAEIKYYTHFGVVLVIADGRPVLFTTRRKIKAAAIEVKPVNTGRQRNSFSFGAALSGQDFRKARYTERMPDCRIKG
jgi:hypothetical protein